MKETPRQLRYALRFIHLLQKERGVSIAHFAFVISHPTNIASDNDAPPVFGIGAALNVEPSHSRSSSSLIESNFWSNALVDARKATDAAFQMKISYNSEIKAQFNVWVKVLQKVRNRVDDAARNSAAACCDSDENSASVNSLDKITRPHQLVVLFNTLIGSVIDEIVTSVIHKEMNWMERNYGSGLASGRRSKANKRLVRSHLSAQNLLISEEDHSKACSIGLCSLGSSHKQLNHFLKGVGVNCHSKDQLQKLVMPSRLARSMPLDGDACTEKIWMPNTNVIGLESKKFVHSSGLIKPYEGQNNIFLVPKGNEDARMDIDRPSNRSSEEFEDEHENQDPRALSTNTANQRTCLNTNARHGEQNVDRNTTIGKHESNSSKMQPDASQIRDLLSLLLSFVQLKQSIGIARSTVCSLMSLRSWNTKFDECKQEINKLFGDLVVEDEHQRKIVRELQSQSKVLKSTSLCLLQMIEKFLRPGKEVKDIMDMIKTFDLEGLQKYMEVIDFWPIITTYIDQLHALELLIVEELQLSYVILSSSVNVRDDDANIAKTSGNTCTSATQKRKEETMYMESGFVTPDDSQTSPCPKSVRMDVISSLLQLDKEVMDSDVMDEINKMPAAQIKQRILENMQGDNVSNAFNSQIQNSFHISEEIKNTLMKKEPIDNLQEWQIDLYEIDFCERIGRGVAGTTYLAKWSGQHVAVKVASITDLGLEGWVTEVNSLKRLHHPNVIRLLGSIYNSSPQTYGLVLEYCNSGDLSESLQYQTPPNFFWKIAKDVANGMSYLHRKSIMHRDIKPANILLDGDVAGGNFSAKVTDFGVAVMQSGQSEEHTAETGTYRWMAPEVIRHESYSFMADVYSYALVVWQLITHEIPFENISQIEAAGKVAIEGARPPFPPCIPNPIRVLIERCWSDCPDDRLPFSQITSELEEIYNILEENEKSWLREPEGQPVYQVEPQDIPLNGSRGFEIRDRTRSTDKRQSCDDSNSGNSEDLFSDFLNR